MTAEDSNVDVTRWHSAVQRWMAEFWHMKPDVPEQPAGREHALPLGTLV